MNSEPGRLSAGLHVVSTPIGSARDITLRALDVLAAADVLAAEDTRTLRHLMAIHGVPLAGRSVVAYHDHSGPEVRERLMAAIAEGKSVAYASEAGTPLIADPGYRLIEAAIAAGLPVTAVPGPSAVMAALVLAGLPTDRFLFAGFPPPRAEERRRFLAGNAAVPATVVYFESPRRVHDLVTDLVKTAGGMRRAAICRELTKRFEEVLRGTLSELETRIAGQELKGEIVVLVDRGEVASSLDVEGELAKALATMSVKDAAEAVARASGLPRRDVYRLALKLGKPE